MRIGLISDTHGLLRPAAMAALDGVEVILHAGDVGAHSVLRELQAIAPVHAVYGNVDDPTLLALPPVVDLTLGGLRVHISHGNEVGSPTPGILVRTYSADVIVYGHTHKPLIEQHGRTLVVNPGAAGPKRFNLKPTVGILTIVEGKASAEIVRLDGD